MKKIFLVILLIMSVGINAEIKIGFVQIDQILKQAPQTAISTKKLEKEFKAKTDKLKKAIDT